MIEGQTLHPGSPRQRQVCLFVCSFSFLLVTESGLLNRWFAHFYLLVDMSMMLLLYAHFYLLVTESVSIMSMFFCMLIFIY